MSNYPLFINELIDILSSMSGKSVAALKIPVLLNQGKYNEVIEILPDYNVQRGRRKTNDSFREFLSDFCNREIIFEEDLSETF